MASLSCTKLLFATLGRHQLGLSHTRMRAFGFLAVSLFGLAALSYYEKRSNDRKRGGRGIHHTALLRDVARHQWESALNKNFPQHATHAVGPFYSVQRRYRLHSSK